jgi:hypothetical protein
MCRCDRLGRALLMSVAFLSLSACISAPYGEFNGKNPTPSDPAVHDVVVVWVDGQLVFDTSRHPISVGSNLTQRLDLGQRHLTLQEVAPGNPPLIDLALTVESCVRYNFVAKESGGVSELVAIGTSPIRHCVR